MKSNSLRADMPFTAAIIDSWREAGEADMVNAAVRGGISGSGEFYAKENGIEIGSRPVEIAGRAVNGLDLAPSFAAKGKK